MNKVLNTLCAVVLLTALYSCEKAQEVAGAAEGSSVLTVQTRSGETDEEISYPITVYVMNNEGVCVRREKLLSANDELSLHMQPLTYTLYAVAGAEEESYTIPELSDAVPTSAVTLKEGEQHADLMTASSLNVTLGVNESNTATLTMYRRVMELKEITINDVPATVDAVSVVLSPIYSNMLLNGTYSEGTGEQTITLEEQEDGTTWKLANKMFMLPAKVDPTIVVKFHKGANVTSYTYTSPQPLEADKHIEIRGTYTGSDGLTLTGVITGATWNGTTTIEFSFDENGSTTTGGGSSGGDQGGDQGDDDVTPGEAPAKNSIYQGCLVTNTAADETGQYTIVTLMHPDEETLSGSGLSAEAIETAINTKLTEVYNADEGINGIKGWRLPTSAEVAAVQWGLASQAIQGITFAAFSNKFNYYRKDNGGISVFIGNNGGMNDEFTYQMGERLRPFTTLKFAK